MYTLGINAALSEPSACLVKDGVVSAAAEEERFTGNRQTRTPFPLTPCEIPFHAINYCLAEEKIVLSDIDHIAYSFNPFLPRGAEWDQVFLSATANAARRMSESVPHYLTDRLGNVDADGPFVWHFVDHHLAHAAGAFLSSPFTRAAIMTMDGGGETASTTYSHGTPGSLASVGEVSAGYSIKRLYDEIAEYLGFQGTGEECRIVELSALGKPLYAEEFRKMVVISGAGQYSTQKTSLSGLFGPARGKNETLIKKHFDIAASLQVVFQETVVTLLQWLRDETGEKNLCLSGEMSPAIALNSSLRQRLPFEALWVQPAPGDAGTAVGAALWIDFVEGRHAETQRLSFMERADLGPSYPPQAIESFLIRSRVRYRHLDDIAGETAALLAAGKIVGWFQGRMEFGPRSLGFRSIFASPSSLTLRRKLNVLKNREDFRPCAASVPLENAAEWFTDAGSSPFMLFSSPIRPEKMNIIPACCHADATAAVHTVDKDHNPLFHGLLSSFGEKTGIPVLAHTSMNISGHPIACSPQDAAECFWTMPLDALVLGPFLIEKPSPEDGV